MLMAFRDGDAPSKIRSAKEVLSCGRHSAGNHCSSTPNSSNSYANGMNLLSHHPLPLDELDDLIEALIGLEIAEHERALAAHFPGLAVHHFERGADHGGE